MAAQAAPPDLTTQLQTLFTELDRLIKAETFARALIMADKILALSPNDADALACKRALLIKQGAFGEALKMCSAEGTVHLFERAYCLFRQGHLSEALALLDAQPGAVAAALQLRELQAQLLYRLERPGEAVAAYRELLAAADDEYEDERRANMVAALAALAAEDTALVPEAVAAALPTDTYEQTYNAGTLALARGQCDQALTLLARAGTMCEALAREDNPDLKPDELAEELALVHAQTGVVLQQKGRAQEALALYQAVLKTKPADPGLATVAANNIIAVNKDRDILDSRKKLKQATSDSGMAKLTRAQRAAVNHNACLLMFHGQQHEACRTRAADLARADPTKSGDVPVLISVAGALREKKFDTAVYQLEELSKRAVRPARAHLALAQLHLSKGNATAAAAVLTNSPALRQHAGMVGALVAVRTNMGDIDGACALMDEAGKAGASAAMMRAAADFSFAQGRFADAAAAYRRLGSAGGSGEGDAAVTARLVMALSKVNLAEATAAAAQLPPDSEADDGAAGDAVDAATLESTARTARGRAARAQADLLPSSAAAATTAKPKRHRKKRPGKLPKDYNPLIPPDPERWIPKRDRMASRSRRGRGKIQVGKGTQGSVAAAPPSKAAAAAASPAATPGSKAGSGAPTVAALKASVASGAAAAAAPAPKSPTKKK